LFLLRWGLIQTCLELMIPASATWVLTIQTCATMPSSKFVFIPH
jgi:hypothetical protein